LRLPSDSTSQWTPLPSACDSRQLARSGLEPYKYMVCMAHNKNPEEFSPGYHQFFIQCKLLFF
ncbi:MAG: hypothetical protein ACK5HT_02260, partial [Draconibacterium sp.]